MGRAGHAVELMQVIRHDPQFHQPRQQRNQRIGRIVHSPEQHRLAQHRHTSIDKPAQGGPGRCIQFRRMVHLHHHNRGKTRSPKPSRQCRTYPVGHNNGHAGVDSEPTQVWNRRQAVGQPPQLLVSQGKRVAAAENNLMG